MKRIAHYRTRLDSSTISQNLLSGQRVHMHKIIEVIFFFMLGVDIA